MRSSQPAGCYDTVLPGEKSDGGKKTLLATLGFMRNRLTVHVGMYVCVFEWRRALKKRVKWHLYYLALYRKAISAPFPCTSCSMGFFSS